MSSLTIQYYPLPPPKCRAMNLPAYRPDWEGGGKYIGLIIKVPDERCLGLRRTQIWAHHLEGHGTKLRGLGVTK